MDATHVLERYLTYAVAGDVAAAVAVVDELSQAGWSAHRVYEDLLTPAQRALGERWRAGVLDTSEEHLATQVGLAVMSRLRESLPSGRQHGKRVGVATVEGDYHDVGARMVADYLLADGWWVLYLGPSLPASSLVRAVEAHRLEVLCLSCSLQSLLPTLQAALVKLRSLEPAPSIVVGGTAVVEDPVSSLPTEGYAVAASPGQAVVEARRLVGLAAEPVGVDAYLSVVGQEIRRLRLERGWSQDQLATVAGMDRTYITMVERGRQNLTMRALVGLATALDVSPQALFGDRQHRSGRAWSASATAPSS